MKKNAWKDANTARLPRSQKFSLRHRLPSRGIFTNARWIQRTLSKKHR